MSTTSDYSGSAGRRRAMIADTNRRRLLLYDRGKWVGGRILSKDSKYVENEDHIYAGSSSSGVLIIETSFVFKGNPTLSAFNRIIYTNNAATNYSIKISVGFMNDSNTFTLIGGNDGNSSTTARQSVVKAALDADGVYVLQRNISLTKRTASVGRKMCIRVSTYFGLWKFDKIWLDVSRL